MKNLIKKQTESCKLRYALRVSDETNTPSKRITYCCSERHGFMLKHWKCVRADNTGCPLYEKFSAERIGQH